MAIGRSKVTKLNGARRLSKHIMDCADVYKYHSVYRMHQKHFTRKECYPVTSKMAVRIFTPRRHRRLFALSKQAHSTITPVVEPVKECESEPEVEEVQLPHKQYGLTQPRDASEKVGDRLSHYRCNHKIENSNKHHRATLVAWLL